MNQKLLEILPKKKTPELLYPAYNLAIDECTAALSKHDVGIIPNEELLSAFIWQLGNKEAGISTISLEKSVEFSKAIREYMMGKDT